VDSNPNLHGKQMGALTVAPPTALGDYPDATIVISSFRSQRAIDEALARQWPNRRLLMYP
jgi:hypothetical protein